jgi:cytochrome bd-type quinol oxidase subunit 2
VCWAGPFGGIGTIIETNYDHDEQKLVWRSRGSVWPKTSTWLFDKLLA